MRASFRNRQEAGERLAHELARFTDRSNLIVLALPRGGVPIGYEIATRLHAPLDVFVVRKLGVPGQEEVAMGAVAPGNVRVLDEYTIRVAGVSPQDIDRITAMERAELERRERRYRGDHPFPNIAGKVVILVDDGLATGSTMRAAVEALRKMSPSEVVVAVPVAAAETCDSFRDLVDEIVCIETPEPFGAVGLWYEDFSQTSDEEVHDLLERAQHART